MLHAKDAKAWHGCLAPSMSTTNAGQKEKGNALVVSPCWQKTVEDSTVHPFRTRVPNCHSNSGPEYDSVPNFPFLYSLNFIDCDESIP